MMTTEMGKTLAAARQEVAKCATACRYYAEHAAGSWPTSPPTPAPSARGSLRQLSAARAGAGHHAVELPALAGHAVRRPRADGGQRRLLKHASNVPQTALFMQDLFARAGFPAGTFQTLLVGSAPGRGDPA